MLTVSVFLPNAYAVEIEEVFKQISDIEEPFELRDPFQPPKLKKRDSKKSSTPVKAGVFTNVPEIQTTNLDEVKITGVLIGAERRAFVKLGDQGPTYTIKEGMTLGPNQAEIKAILPGGIILAEKVVNIYGETEYLETVIPISK